MYRTLVARKGRALFYLFPTLYSFINNSLLFFIKDLFPIRKVRLCISSKTRFRPKVRPVHPQDRVAYPYSLLCSSVGSHSNLMLKNIHLLC